MTQEEKREFFLKLETMMHTQVERIRVMGRDLLVSYVDKHTADPDFVFEAITRSGDSGCLSLSEILQLNAEFAAELQVARDFFALFQKLDNAGWSRQVVENDAAIAV